ncbi:MAG: response regulator transcription factor [Bacteroidota bacterium]
MTTLIIEDDPTLVLDLEIMLSEIGYTKNRVASTVREAEQLVAIQKPDLMLVDVFLKGEETGIHLYKKIASRKIPTVFITASTDPKLYEAVKEIRAVPYLVKPFDQITLKSAIDQSMRMEVKVESKKLLIKHGTDYQQVSISDIIWIESDRNYCIIHTLNRRYIIRLSLVKLMQKIDDVAIAFVNRRTAVRLSNVRKVSFKNNELEITGQTFPIGRAYKKELRNRLNLLN